MGEKIKSMIERDIAIVLLLVTGGLAFSGSNGRGLPLPWLYDGSADTVAFLTDLAILAVIVVVTDIATMMAKGLIRSGDFRRSLEIRKAYRDKKLPLPKTGVRKSEPFAGKTAAHKWTSAAANNERKTDNAAVRQGPGAKEQDFLNRMRQVNRDFEQRTSLRARQNAQRKKKGNPAAASAILIVALTMMIISAVFAGLSDYNDEFEWLGTGDDNGEWEDSTAWVDNDSERGLAVIYLCSQAVDALAEEDSSWLDDVGTVGDSLPLIEMTDWSAADLDTSLQTNMIVYGEPDVLIRRYQIRTESGVFWLAFKFCEPGYNDYYYVESGAALAGIAACRVPDWLMQPPDRFKEQYEGEYLDKVFTGDEQLDDGQLEKLTVDVVSGMKYVGEETADDYPILLSW